MTEQEWLAATDTVPMLNFTGRKASGRKLRLFAVACCRHAWDALRAEARRPAVARWHRQVWAWFADAQPWCGGGPCADPRPAMEAAENAVAVAERFADGLVGHTELQAAHVAADEGYGVAGAVLEQVANERLPRSECADREYEAARLTINATCDRLGVQDLQPSERSDRDAQARFLREIFGNPFRPAALAPDWQTSTVVALASQMYESRDFSAMPILADALQDAGCDSADVLDHCRGPGPHVRGCWVVDLVLGKA